MQQVSLLTSNKQEMWHWARKVSAGALIFCLFEGIGLGTSFQTQCSVRVRGRETYIGFSPESAGCYTGDLGQPKIHHTALRTRNITDAINFYSLFGFEVEVKFLAGPSRAAWLRQEDGIRLELIEIPAYVLQEPEGMKRRALDSMKRPEILGWNHVALDVTTLVQEKKMEQLSDWIDLLNETSVARFGKSLRVALESQQKIIGSGVFELSYIYDADGALVEFLHHQTDLEQEVASGWEPWDGRLELF